MCKRRRTNYFVINECYTTHVYLNYLSAKFFFWIVNIPSITIKTFFVGKCKEGLQKGNFLSVLLLVENKIKYYCEYYYACVHVVNQYNSCYKFVSYFILKFIYIINHQIFWSKRLVDWSKRVTWLNISQLIHQLKQANSLGSDISQ